MLSETFRPAWRVIVAVVGFTVLLLGIVMIVTPGPGWLMILLGLSILSGEFLWARRLLKRMKETGKDVTRAVLGPRETPLPMNKPSEPKRDLA